METSKLLLPLLVLPAPLMLPPLALLLVPQASLRSLAPLVPLVSLARTVTMVPTTPSHWPPFLQALRAHIMVTMAVAMASRVLVPVVSTNFWLRRASWVPTILATPT